MVKTNSNEVRSMIAAAMLGASVVVVTPTKALVLVEDIPHMLTNLMNWIESLINDAEAIMTAIDHYTETVKNNSVLGKAMRMYRKIEEVHQKGNSAYYRANGLITRTQRYGMAGDPIAYLSNWYPPPTTDQAEADAKQRVSMTFSKAWDDAKKFFVADENEYNRNKNTMEFLSDADKKQKEAEKQLDDAAKSYQSAGDHETADQIKTMNAQVHAGNVQQHQFVEVLLQMLSNQNNDQRRKMESARIQRDVENKSFDSTIYEYKVTNPWRT
jgi:hypothetical protein